MTDLVQKNLRSTPISFIDLLVHASIAEPQPLTTNFSPLDQLDVELIYNKAGVSVFKNASLGIIVKQAEDAVLYAQYLAFKVLAVDGFSPPASRFIRQISTEGKIIASFLIMDLIPKDCLHDGRWSRFDEGFNPIHRKYEREARELLEHKGFQSDGWVHEECFANVALKQGVFQKWKETGEICKSDFIPFDPVIGFKL